MKTTLIISHFVITYCVIAQTPLHFVELGSEPAYCRTASYQSGNGVVYAAAAGGVPSYDYQWYHIESGTYLTWYSTYGGLNPGHYQITVTDDIGNILVDTVRVDSINPIAVIEPGGNDVFFNGQYHMANAPAIIDLNNVSLNTGYSLPGPWSDQMSYAWKLGNFEPWVNDTAVWNDTHRQVTFEYGGVQGVCLAIENKNACKDTTCFYFIIGGPAEISEQEIVFQIDIENGTIMVQMPVITELEIIVYDLSGRIVLKSLIFSGEQEQLDLKSGTYVYELKHGDTGKLLKSGKFIY